MKTDQYAIIETRRFYGTMTQRSLVSETNGTPYIMPRREAVIMSRAYNRTRWILTDREYQRDFVACHVHNLPDGLLI